MFGLAQVLFLKIPAVRSYFNIERLVKHPKNALPKKGFVQGFRESYDNAKTAAQIEDRARADALQFKKAGEGPLQKTYSYDPTKLKTIKPLSVKPSSKSV